MLLNEAFRLDFHQADVGFLIPNLAEDLALYVDPYLFYKSTSPVHQAVHGQLQDFFAVAVNAVKQGQNDTAKRMMVFPEVPETMLGLSKGSHSGRGLGPTTDQGRSRGDIIFREIVSNEDIQANGIQHLAEMQLLIEGVGFDMISDMCTNIIKDFLVRYTQEQARLHAVPLARGLVLEHVFDRDELDWDDRHVDLPENPLNGRPILLVPKTVVRRFSEIDYKDFWMKTYRYILRDIEVKRSMRAIGREPKITWKELEEKYPISKAQVVQVLHESPDLKRTYLTKKDAEVRSDPLPSGPTAIAVSAGGLPPFDSYISELGTISPGTQDAKRYEDLVTRILNRLFYPDLRNPRPQVQTFDGREIIDITLLNAADSGFWRDVKHRHGNMLVVFELKNMSDLANEEYQQISSRLSDIKGLFGVLVARRSDNLDVQRAYRRLYHDRQVILTLTDDELITMLRNASQGLSPTMEMQRIYRKFLEEA